MEMVKEKCLGRNLGIAKGLRFDILDNGESIGNVFRIENITTNNDGLILYSELLGTRVNGIFKLSQFLEMIESNEIILI